MIFVDGVSFPTELSLSDQGREILAVLKESPVILSATNSFKATPEMKFSVSEQFGHRRLSKCIYLFQREYATVDPALVEFIGTDEATTCVGIAIRNRKTGMTSVAHMDSPDVVDTGFSQMLSLVVDASLEDDLDVHLVGGYEDVSPKQNDRRKRSKGRENLEGYSFPLCTKIVKVMLTRPEKFHLKTLCVLSHNTRRDSEGISSPIFNGFVIQTSNGSVIPASFENTLRCPDEIVRRIRVSSSYEDRTWSGKLLDTYETLTDRFKIEACCWTFRQMDIAFSLQSLSDSEILRTCSTSPSVEDHDFVNNLRRVWAYLIEHPNWKETFPKMQPRIFQRTVDGGWELCSDTPSTTVWK